MDSLERQAKALMGSSISAFSLINFFFFTFLQILTNCGDDADAVEEGGSEGPFDADLVFEILSILDSLFEFFQFCLYFQSPITLIENVEPICKWI